MKPVFGLIIIFILFVCYAEERTYSISMLGHKIGTSTEKWEKVQHKDGKCFIKLDTKSSMEVSRGRDSVKLYSKSTTIVKCKTFKPVSIKTETKETATGVKGSGHVKDNTFFAEIIKNRKKESFSYPLSNDLTFFSMIFKKYPPEKLLKGGKINVISEESLHSVPISFSGKKVGPSHFEIDINFSGVPIKFHIVDKAIVRSELQNGLIVYELIEDSDSGTSQKKEKRTADIIELTSKSNSGITVKHPRKTRKVVFSFSGKNLPEIPSNCYQSVTRKNSNEVVTVNMGASPCGIGDVSGSDLKPNIFEDSDSPSIIKVANKLGSGVKGRDALINKVISFVFKHIRDKNYSHGNLSASETLKKRAGDCTEHSTLLSAILKALKIPTRMVYGIVLDQEGNFFFHNWNEVYTKKGWISVDSTFGMKRADAARIVLAYGGSDASSREQVALTVLRFLGSDFKIYVNGFFYE